MKLGVIMGYIDVAQVTLFAFWVFFGALIFYLRREDRREGYPLFSEPSNTYHSPGAVLMPTAKTFLLSDGTTVSVPSGKGDDRPMKAEKIAVWPGAPIEPTGDPMLAAVGPGSYAERRNIPDPAHDGSPKIVPMRTAPAYSIPAGEADPRGYDVMGADNVKAGVVRDAWVDKSETMIRYLEVEVSGATPRTVLLPITFAVVNWSRRTVDVDSILARHFASVPALANPNQVTLLEEDKVAAFYGAGTLYADPRRSEPLL